VEKEEEESLGQKPFTYFFLAQAFNGDDLAPAGMTFDDGQSPLTHTQSLTEKSYQFFIGLALDRRRSYFYLPDPVGKVNHLIPGGIGVNPKPDFGFTFTE